MQDAAERFVQSMAAAVLRDGDPAARAAEAHAALGEVLSAQKSLVLDVQFTGFSAKGQLVGRVSGETLRAAGHLITQRVSRIGFTPDARAADLRDVFGALGRAAGEHGEGGIVGTVSGIAPRGIYLSTAGGEVYKPAPRAPAPAPASPSTETPGDVPQPPAAATAVDAPQPAAAPSPADEAAAPSGWAGDAFESTELEEFEILDTFDTLRAPEGAAAPGGGGAGAPGAGGGGEGPGSNDMFHFFRAAGAGQESAESLPGLLHETDNISRFDDLADTAARAALSLIRSDAHAEAVQVLDALVREAQRPDRTRVFRDAALQALRRVGTPDTLQRLLELLTFAGAERERILRFFAFTGGDALLMLEGALHRVSDPELRLAMFRTLLTGEGMADKLIARAVQDPNPVRARTLLELATQAGMDPDVARRWSAESAAHREPAVRAEAARAAAAMGGRGSMRVLLDLLGDPERSVKREAVQGLGNLGDTAAVPFLVRVLNDTGDEEMQAIAAAALGRIGSGEALPGLLSLVTKRSLLSLKKATRPKIAALQAIARINTPGARDALQSVSSGRDELAEEARRLLAAL